MAAIMKYVEFSRTGGDYVEFGVYRGASLVAAWQAAERLELDAMRFVGFDSFAGLPTPENAGEHQPFRAGDFAAPRHTVEDRLARLGVDTSRVSLVDGWFQNTVTADRLADLGVRSVAVAWFDCDLRSSTLDALGPLTALLVEGAVLVFRDWWCYRGDPDQGQQAAVGDWLEAHPEVRLIPYRSLSWNGEAFILRPARSKAPTPTPSAGGV